MTTSTTTQQAADYDRLRRSLNGECPRCIGHGFTQHWTGDGIHSDVDIADEECRACRGTGQRPTRVFDPCEMRLAPVEKMLPAVDPDDPLAGMSDSCCIEAMIVALEQIEGAGNLIRLWRDTCPSPIRTKQAKRIFDLMVRGETLIQSEPLDLARWFARVRAVIAIKVAASAEIERGGGDAR